MNRRSDKMHGDFVAKNMGRPYSLVEISADDLDGIQFGVELAADHLAFGPQQIIGGPFRKLISQSLKIALPLGNYQVHRSHVVEKIRRTAIQRYTWRAVASINDRHKAQP